MSLSSRLKYSSKVTQDPSIHRSNLDANQEQNQLQSNRDFSKEKRVKSFSTKSFFFKQAALQDVVENKEEQSRGELVDDSFMNDPQVGFKPIISDSLEKSSTRRSTKGLLFDLLQKRAREQDYSLKKKNSQGLSKSVMNSDLYLARGKNLGKVSSTIMGENQEMDKDSYCFKEEQEDSRLNKVTALWDSRKKDSSHLNDQQIEKETVAVDLENQASFKRQNTIGKVSLGQALLQALNAKLLSDVIDISEYIVKFSLKNFLKFMVYHLLWFYTGFATVLFVYAFDSWALAKNMSFWIGTKNKISFYTQIFQWTVLSALNAMYLCKYFKILDDNSLQSIYPEQVLFLNVQIIIRSFIIAVRYSYASKLRLFFLSQDNQESSYITQDLFFYQWRNLNPFGLMDEIESAVWRNKVIESNFRYSVYETLCQDLGERLTNEDYYENQRQTFSMDSYISQTSKFKRALLAKQNIAVAMAQKSQTENDHQEPFKLPITIQTRKYYPGSLLLREIALQASANQTPTGLILVGIITLRLSIPFLIHLMSEDSSLHFEDPYSIAFTVLENLFMFVLLAQNFAFVIFGFTDFQRRNYMISAVGALINPRKLEHSLKYQIFPTINPCSKKSLYTWFKIRECVLDLGRKYMNRVLIYSSVFLGFYSFYAAFFLLSYFSIIGFQFSTIMNAYAIFDITIVLTVLISMLYQGAVINSKFAQHKIQLVNIKSCLLYLKMKVGKMHLMKPVSFDECHNMILKIFQQNAMSPEANKEMIDELTAYIDNLIEKLDIDSEGKPLKLLGITASFGLMNTIYTGLATIAVALIQYQFSQSQAVDSFSTSLQNSTEAT